jgi:putative ABC transport system permease protein
MGIPLLQGRDFTEADSEQSNPVAIVSQWLVRQQYPGEDPIGKRLYVNIGGVSRPIGAEIVGVVGDIKMNTLSDDTLPAIYLPHTQLWVGLMTFAARTSLEPTSLTPAMAAAVRSLDPSLPLADVATMDDVVGATLARPRTVSTLISVFALIALALAGVGVYGVMSYSVSQRTQEIGVRMALGASAQSVFRMMIGQALKLVLAGIVAGAVAAAWLSQFLTTLLFQTRRFDPWTFVLTALILAAVAALASYVPARRGTRIAPVEALRAE